MEGCTMHQDPNKDCNTSVEEEKEEAKDLVCKHFREVNDGLLFNNGDEPIRREKGSMNKKDDQTVKGHCKVQQRAVFSGKILSFGCSLCKDNVTFSPNDLLKHFQAVHKGSLPTYPCDLCDFVTNEFSALQRHRIEHRNTLVTCELCNDNVQYSLLLLTRHYMMCHSINGEFKCDWCEFTTVDAGTFVQHIHHHNESHWKCSKCKHISLNEEDHHNHMKAHSGKFSFTCQICGFGTAEMEHLKKHTAAVHKEEAQRKMTLKPTEDCASPANTSTNLKLYKKICVSQEIQGMSKLNSSPGSVLNENGRLTKQEQPLEEIHHLIDGTAGRKDNRSWSFHNAEHLAPVMLQECENANNSDTGSHPNANGLTVLMVKNKISLPPNCTTKVLGFKLVDGKKHLVLKVIPTAKQGVSSQNHALMDGVGPFVSNPVITKKIDSDCTGSTSKSLAISPKNGSCIQMDHEDIMAVKVKVEEEETSVTSTPHSECEQMHLSQSQSYSVEDEDARSPGDSVCTEKRKVQVAKNSDATNFNCDGASYGSKMNNSQTPCGGIITGQSPLNPAQKTLLSKTPFRERVENIGTADDSSLAHGFGRLYKKYKGNSVTNNLHTNSTCHIAQENSDGTTIENSSESLQIVQHLESPSQLCQSFSVDRRLDGLDTEKSEPKTSNQEVFTFHNYSKEMFTSSPCIAPNLHFTGESLAHTSASEPSHFRSRLTESPEHTTENTDGEPDECIANDDTLTEDNGDSVFQDFNIIKIEEDCVPVSTKQSEPKTSLRSIQRFVKEHSNAIITQQLIKERTGPSNATNTFLKQAKKPLQILQFQGGNQPVLVRATNNKFAMQVQVKATPGFKLLTSSADPQVSLSSMKQEFNNLSNATGVGLTPQAKIVGLAAGTPKSTEKGTLLSALHSGGSTSSSHYFINSQGIKRPLLLSRTLHSTPTNIVAKAQPTCYFVRRSVPSVQKPNTASFKLPGPETAVSSQPVLAGNFAEKASAAQTSRQAYLLRYISPSRSNLFASKQEAKKGTVWSQTSECSGNKVIFKLVSPPAHLNTTVAATSRNQPLLLATRTQGQCFLVSANKTSPTSGEVKKLVSVQTNLQEPSGSHSLINGKPQQCEVNRPLLAPRLISQRKRHRKRLVDEPPTTPQKTRRLSNKVLIEKDNVLWTPVGKEMERKLRLTPFQIVQQIKYPCRFQPVVVLNHPDADIPEVTNIMKAVNRYKGAVTKVALSQKTVQALCQFSGLVNNCSTSLNGVFSTPRPVLSSVQERFLLKLKLRKKTEKKYEVVKTLSSSGKDSVVFDCWFCGRLFNNQEDWISHGQRHLIEATRDWNKLF